METDKWERVKNDQEDKLIDFIDDQEVEDEAIDTFLLVQIASELYTIRQMLGELSA